MSLPRFPAFSCLVMLMTATPTLHAVEWELDAGVGVNAGDWTYGIGGLLQENGEKTQLPFPISEIKWPLETLTLHAGARAEMGALTLHGRLAGSLGNSDSGVEDSDWEDLDHPNVRTTYSESDAEIVGWEGDLGALVKFAQVSGLGLQAGAGVLNQSWSWDASDAMQVSVVPGESGLISGKAIEYEGDFIMPYLQMGAFLKTGVVTLRARVGYSPWAQADDRDDHLLRGIVSEADTEGDGWLAEADFHIDLGKRFYGFAHARLLAFQTSGTSRNRVYASDDPDTPNGASWVIDEEIDSTQVAGSAGFGLRL